MTPSNRVVIVGAGNVGSSIAYCLISNELSKEIIMIDIADDLVISQVLDMQDSCNFTKGITVNRGNYSDIENGDIVVITCGAAQKPGQTRLDLLKINAKIIRSVLTEIKNTGKNVYILMVTNPVDVLTYIAIKESGLPANQVFGSGTFLDSARLRVVLSRKLGIGTTSTHAHVLGEHGDSSFPSLSTASVSSIPLSNFMKIDDDLYTKISEEVRDKAYEIIKGKHATYYGIGSAVTRIIEAIMKDENRIMPLTTLLDGEYGHSDVAISVPVRIGSSGVKLFKEMALNNREKAMFARSVSILKSNIESVKDSN